MDSSLKESTVDEAMTTDRRAALKAALGGAAAAAVLAGPKIEGLSVAPRYAAASTSGNVAYPLQTTGGTSGQTTTGQWYACWNAWSNFNSACSTTTRSGDIAIEDPEDGELIATIEIDQAGPVYVTNGGTFTYRLVPSGDPNRVVTCTGEISGACLPGGGSFVSSATSVTPTTTLQSATIYCNGSNPQNQGLGNPSVGMAVTCEWYTP